MYTSNTAQPTSSKPQAQSSQEAQKNEATVKSSAGCATKAARDSTRRKEKGKNASPAKPRQAQPLTRKASRTEFY